MYGLTVKPKISVSFTEDWWELYEHRDSHLIANILNQNLEKMVNGGATEEETRQHMGKLMKQYSQYGTNDSEPWRLLDRALEEIYRRPA
jgi:hypothetical protein